MYVYRIRSRHTWNSYFIGGVYLSKAIVIGLEGAEPSILFNHLEALPNLKKIADSGSYGRLRSCYPPSSSPAWPSMVTGMDPGQLGLYGSYQRKSYTRYSVSLVNNTILKEPTIWDILGNYKFKSIVMGVPLTCPPRPLKEALICCLSPLGHEISDTYPEALKKELDNKVDYPSGESRYKETKMSFATARYLLTTKKWDFFMMVDASIEQMHSLYLEDTDKIVDYYKYIDEEVGSIISLIPSDTRVFIVSGYGVKKVEGIFYLNEWLFQEGYLKLKEAVQKPTNVTEDLIDWKETRAWGAGGSFGSIWLNVKRRESQGVIPREKYEYTRNILIHKMISLTDQTGVPLYTKVFKPSKIYSKVTNVPADLFLYLRNLNWRSSSMIGTGELHSNKVEISSRINNSFEGVFISSGNLTKSGGEEITVHISDIAPTILREFGINPLKGMNGKSIPL